MRRKEEGSVQRTLSPSKRGFVWEMKHNRTLYLMCVPALLLQYRPDVRLADLAMAEI